MKHVIDCPPAHQTTSLLVVLSQEWDKLSSAPARSAFLQEKINDAVANTIRIPIPFSPSSSSASALEDASTPGSSAAGAAAYPKAASGLDLSPTTTPVTASVLLASVDQSVVLGSASSDPAIVGTSSPAALRRAETKKRRKQLTLSMGGTQSTAGGIQSAGGTQSTASGSPIPGGQL